MTPEETIKKIAEKAHAIAAQAGVGGMELAGQFVSVLTAHPEKIDQFLSDDFDWIEDNDLLHAERGCLSWHSRTGELITPAKLRALKSTPDH